MINKKSGFSIIELLVVMSILAIVTIIAGSFIINTFKYTSFDQQLGDSIVDARTAMNIMSKEIRGANNSEQGSYPIDTANDDNFIFYSDINDDGEMEKISYLLISTTTLIKVVNAPGVLNDYSTTGATTTIARYVNNQSIPIFRYFDSNYATSTAINYIRLVNITLKLNVNPDNGPNDFIVETDVHFRNLKDNL